jgi:hypothetical protein
MKPPKEKTMQPELPMKDITPKKAAPKKKPESLAAKQDRLKAEAMVAKPKLPAVAPVQHEAKSLLAVIADAAANPNCNPENMRALLDMQKEIVAEQRRCDFEDAFVALQAAMPRITADRKITIKAKDSKGERTGKVLQATPYVTFQAMMKVVQPLLTKHGFGLSFRTEPMADGRILVTGILSRKGHERTSSFPLPAEVSGSKNNIQGWGSSQSYGKRYCTIALLNIVSEAVEDADTDGHDGDFQRAKGGNLAEVTEDAKITKEQRDKIVEQLMDADIGLGKFCQRYGIAQVQELPANLFMAAQKAIADHKASTGGGKVK